MGYILDIQQSLVLEPLEEETALVPRFIEWTAESVVRYMDNAEEYRISPPVYWALDTVYEYAISVMGVIVSLINNLQLQTYFDMNSIQTETEVDLGPFWTFALDEMGFIYNETADRFDMVNSGLIGGMYYRIEVMKETVNTIVNTTIPDLEKRMGDLESSLGELTPEVIEKIEIVAENIDEILDFMENGVEYLIGEVQAGLLTMVKGYVDPQINIVANGIDDLWVEVRRYGNVFVDVILSLINIMLTGVQIPTDQIENIMASINNWITEEVTKQTASIQAEVNVLYNEVYLMSDVWIAALKKKLVI